MSNLQPIENNNQRVLTTAQIAEQYETDSKVISNNFNRNKTRYIEGKHYYCLTGEVKRDFLNRHQIDDGLRATVFYLWTEKGALLHAKSLNTDKAWQSYEMLVDTYFEVQETKRLTGSELMAAALLEAHAVLEQKEKRITTLEQQAEQDKPKVLFADSVATAKNSILIGELAKILRQNGVETGQQRLFEWMRENGFLIKRKGSDYNMPTQRAMNMGLFEVKETAIPHADGHVSISKTPKVTGKGQIYFVHKLMGAEPLLPSLENEKECHQ